MSLIACGAIAAFAGLLVSRQSRHRRPDDRPGLPAARLRRRLPRLDPVPRRALQRLGHRRRGYVLATGVKGLQLAGAPVWIPDLFNGVALLLAVGLAKYETTATRAGAVRRLLRFDRGGGGRGGDTAVAEGKA